MARLPHHRNIELTFRFSAADKIPRCHKMGVASIPSGMAIRTERIVPAIAMASVEAMARNTMRKKSAESSGGNRPRRKVHRAASVAGCNKVFSRTSSTFQQMTRTNKPARTTATRRNVQSRSSQLPLLSTAAKFALEAIFILNLPGLLGTVAVEIAQKVFMHLARCPIKSDVARPKADDTRKMI